MTNVMSIFIFSLLLASNVLAEPKSKHKGPLGYGDVPPGLAKTGSLPPGLAKNYYVCSYLPMDIYLPLELLHFSRLSNSSKSGREGVGFGRDVYLIASSTGVITRWA